MAENSKNFFLGKEITLGDIAGYIKKYTNIFKPALIKCLFVIVFFTVLFSIIGYVAKVTSSKEYESQCVLYNEQNSSTQNSTMQALALLSGASSNTGTEATGGDLYQLILINRPFLLELASSTVDLKNLDSSKTLYQYFDKEEELDLVERTINRIKNSPGQLVSFLFNKPKPPRLHYFTKSIADSWDSSKVSFVNKPFITELTGNDKRIISILSNRIKLKQNGKLSTLLVKMPEAKLSAQVNKLVLELLTKYAIRFKVSKQLENVEFLEARTKEAEAKYKESQQKVANFKDNNYNVVFQSVQSRESVLQNEFLLYSGIYNQLVSQLEQAKIQLKKDSPLFTVVEPVYIPEEVASDNSKINSYGLKGLIVGLVLSIYFLYRAYKKSTLITVNS
jgi:capsule polysaccharide export protein KpsE/RkpR